MFRKAWRRRTRIGFQKGAGSRLGCGPLGWPMLLISDTLTDDVDVLNQNLVLIQNPGLHSEPASLLPLFV